MGDRSPILPASPVRPDAIVEPGPMSLVPPLVLASLPPPPSAGFTLPGARESSPGGYEAAPGLREPSTPPPSLDAAIESLDPMPPMLTLAPSLRLDNASSEDQRSPVERLASVAPEALELDLSVLGPSEHPPGLSEHSGVREGMLGELEVEELDAMELSEVRVQRRSTRKVAPPLPPPGLRKVR